MKIFQIGCVVLTSVAVCVACGDDDDTGGNTNGGSGGQGGLASGGTRSDGGVAGILSTDRGGTAGGPHPMGGEVSAAGAASSAGGAGGDGEGGAAGAGLSAGGSPAHDTGGAAAGGEGGAGPSEPDPARLACPPLGETFTIDGSSEPSLGPIAAMFGCDLAFTQRFHAFRVQRFTVTEQTLAIAWQEHSLDPYNEAFAIEDDCGPNGLAVPTYTGYPHMRARELSPGTYTWVDCAQYQTFHETVPMPPAPTNVDCAHAVPLDASMRYLGLPQYFLWSTPVPVSSLELALKSKYSSASLTATLRGTTNNFSTVGNVPYMVFGIGVSIANVPAGDYCLKVESEPGAQVNIAATPICPTPDCKNP